MNCFLVNNQVCNELKVQDCKIISKMTSDEFQIGERIENYNNGLGRSNFKVSYTSQCQRKIGVLLLRSMVLKLSIKFQSLLKYDKLDNLLSKEIPGISALKCQALVFLIGCCWIG
eukprot:TRINITY_DN6412_c3_g1_i1.p4 TRINITY_DN6412_c3_g1~~TRINITY_DN6412_c3_g1_i1.p4  ORF type:complete len:115 (+),score=1.91 TRINITY_DN6412_c3_g1_i1:614-958(+)